MIYQVQNNANQLTEKTLENLIAIIALYLIPLNVPRILKLGTALLKTCKELFANAEKVQGNDDQIDLVAFLMLKSGKVISEVLSETFLLKEV